MDYKLILFDLDGTLAPFNSDELYPDAAAWLAEHDTAVAVCTNQGGVGLRYWMETAYFGEPAKFPTLDSVMARLSNLFPDNGRTPPVFLCVRYQSKKSGSWSPVPPGNEHVDIWQKHWRKPDTGMLVAAMTAQGCAPQETLMVGDGEEDREAAENAGCAFQWAWEFFGREQPISESKE